MNSLETLLKIFYGTILFLFSTSLAAEQVYWVGGSGSWSDPSHWSSSSGGSAGAGLPSVQSDVVIDANSFVSSGEIIIDHHIAIKSLESSSDQQLVISGGGDVRIIIQNSFSLNNLTTNEFLGSAHLLNKNESFRYESFDPGTFQGVKNNGSTKKYFQDNFQPLEVTSIQIDTTLQQCPESNDGAFKVTPLDGGGPFAYYWTIVGCPGAQGLDTDSVYNVCRGSHSLLIVDSTDLEPHLFAIDMGPNPISTVIISSSDESCAGANDGSITAFADGGTKPLQYSWSNGGGNSLSVNGLSPGNYVLTVTDDNGCVAPANPSATINPAPAIIPIVTPSDIPTCNGPVCTEDVTFAVDPTSGNGPPFNWDNGTGTTDMCPGDVYTSTVTDALNCPLVVTHTASMIPPITLTTTEIDTVTCLGVADGAASAAASGGTAPYVYNWTNIPPTATVNATGDTVTNLPAGTYNVEVVDDNLCTQTATVTVTSPSPQVVSATAIPLTNASCLQASNGGALATGSGGTPQYLFDWYDAPGTPSTSSASGLSVGTYNVEVKDQDGCVDTAQVIISSPPVSPLTITITSTDVVCLGKATGSASVSVTGGAPQYDFEWYNITGKPTTAAVDSLDIGTYNVEVTDQDGCIDTGTVIIDSPNPPVITTTLNPVNQPSCTVGACDGSATATSSGGRGPYQYDWFDAPGSPSSPSVSNLCQGSYTLAVEDQDGCKDTVTLSFVPPLQVSLDSKTDVACGGVCTGVIDVSGSGGSGAYAYDWYDMTGSPVANPANDSLSGVCAGVFHVAISDAGGIACLDTLEVTIVEPPTLVINIDKQVPNLCTGDCNGEIEVRVSGGAAPYNALWTDSNGVVPSVPALTSLTGLCNGNYTYEVTDDNGCVTTENIAINSPQTNVNFTVSPLCPSDLVANVQALAAGGTAPYRYKWLDPVTGADTNNVQLNLLPGSYDLEVIDVNLCTDTFNFTFAVPQPFANSSVVSDAQCQGVCNGTIDATISGGTGPYQYSWFDMTGTPTTEDLTNVCAGQYNLAIEDDNGCRDTLKTVVVNAITSLGLTSDETQATCQGLCDGKAWVTASNGTPAYSYNWYDAPAGSAVADTAFNMCVGTYNVEISDQQGCIDTVAATVTAPQVVNAAIINNVQNLCAQDCNGSAEVAISGGKSPYSISWETVPGDSTQAVVSNLCNGLYVVEITDDNNCQDTAHVTINSQSGTVTFNTTNPSCGGYNDGSIVGTQVGVPGPSSVVWINPSGVPGLSVSGLSQGTYQLELTDNNNCVDTFSVSLVDPFPPIDLQVDSQFVSCFGLCDGKAWATPTGGASPYTYSWDYPAVISITDTATNLCVGQHFVAVEDNNGCQDTAVVNIIEPFQVNLSSTSKPPCFGICDGNAKAIVTGEVSPFSYEWNDLAATKDSAISGLCAGTYKVIVTSATGCKDSTAITLTENTEIKGVLDTTRSTCTNTPDGTAKITPSGGVAPYTYLWTDGGAFNDNKALQDNLIPGKYWIVVTDDVGCTHTDSIVVTETTPVSANAGEDLSICLGDSIDINGQGVAVSLWNNGETNDTIRVSPAVTTTYTLTVTNGPVCQDQDQVTVTVNLNPNASASSDEFALLEGFEMSTTLRGQGAGTGGTYDWTPPINLNDPTLQDPIVSPKVSTRYLVTVTDENGCQDTASVFIELLESIIYSDALSPNNDGINDFWPIKYIENFPDAVVEIYNRWGQVLFHSEGYKDQWDGTYQGKALPVGTYYFIIDLGPDLPKYNGPITIFR